MSGEQAGAAVEVLAQPEFRDEPGTVRELLLGTWRGRFGVAVVALSVFMAMFGSAIAPYDPNASSLDVLAPPSIHHLLGTTENGSDVFSQILVGARVSIVVGFAAAAISAVLGSVVGLVGGYFGGWTDRSLDALENWFLVIPTLPLMIVLARLLNPSLTVLIAVIGLTSWAGTGRIVRAQVLTLRERAFVERARALGAGDTYIIRNAHPSQHAAADLRQHGPDRGRRDPLRGRSVVPRPRRPDPDLVGDDARERVRVGRAERRGVVVRDPAGTLHHGPRAGGLDARLPVRGARQPAAA